MSFESLKVPELVDVADFFVVDVAASNPEKGPTKKELLAALSGGDDPVTWEQYETVYLVAKRENTAAPKVEDDELELNLEEPKVEDEPVDRTDWQLVKMERHNPTFEVYGFVFSKRHPYQNVPPEVAVKLLREQEGFRLAMPDELVDFYN